MEKCARDDYPGQAQGTEDGCRSWIQQTVPLQGRIYIEIDDNSQLVKKISVPHIILCGTVRRSMLAVGIRGLKE